MPTAITHPTRGCTGFSMIASSRRQFLEVGTVGMLGLSLGEMLRLEAADPAGAAGKAPARNVIQIFLPGGCAHQESWDPKPEAPIDYRGPLGVVKTTLPGIAFSQHLPRCAAIIDRLTVLRGVTARIPDHAQSQYHLLTGYTPSPAIQHPQMGAIVSHELGGMNDLPAWIGVPAAVAGPSTGYLPAKFGCFNVAADPGNASFQVRDVSLPSTLAEADFRKRKTLRDVVGSHFRALETDGAALATMDEFYQQAYALLASPRAQAAFGMSGESEATKQLYGCGGYRAGRTKQPFTVAERFIFARRLVEAGARFVSVSYDGDGGWDSHARIADVFNDQMPAFDHALAGLIADLDSRGLLDSTLVMVMTEFGRTPKINSSAGRDHHAKCFSLVLAGGGVTRGQVFGSSDSIAAEPARDAVSVEDCLATCYHLLGIDPDKRLMAPGDRPIDIVRGGRVVKGIIA